MQKTSLQRGKETILRLDLTGRYLRRRQMAAVRLSEADLRGADLTESSLDDARLTNSNLAEAHLHRSSLKSAACFRADLRAAAADAGFTRDECDRARAALVRGGAVRAHRGAGGGYVAALFAGSERLND